MGFQINKEKQPQQSGENEADGHDLYVADNRSRRQQRLEFRKQSRKDLENKSANHNNNYTKAESDHNQRHFDLQSTARALGDQASISDNHRAQAQPLDTVLQDGVCLGHNFVCRTNPGRFYHQQLTNSIPSRFKKDLAIQVSQRIADYACLVYICFSNLVLLLEDFANSGC